MKKLNEKQLEAMSEWFEANMPMINSGGCGIFAYLFVERFGGRIWRVDPPEIYERDLYNRGLEQICTNCNGNSSMSASHFIVEQDGVFFDAINRFEVEGEGEEAIGQTVDFNCKTDYYVISCEYTRAQMLTAVIEGGWNPHFYFTLPEEATQIECVVGGLAYIKARWNDEVVPGIQAFIGKEEEERRRNKVRSLAAIV